MTNYEMSRVRGLAIRDDRALQQSGDRPQGEGRMRLVCSKDNYAWLCAGFAEAASQSLAFKRDVIWGEWEGFLSDNGVPRSCIFLRIPFETLRGAAVELGVSAEKMEPAKWYALWKKLVLNEFERLASSMIRVTIYDENGNEFWKGRVR